jgi:hypothetical protein
MSGIQIASLSVLWVVVLLLGALVLLLYRQVDKAYRAGDSAASVPIPSGSEAPALEVFKDGRIQPLQLSAPDDFTVLAFVTASCGSCQQLMTTLSRGEGLKYRTYLLFAEGPSPRNLSTSPVPTMPSNIEVRTVAHPPDIRRDYGVMSFPFVYLLRGGLIVAAGPAKERLEVIELERQAVANWHVIDKETDRMTQEA